jgi:hypothetical protein
VSAVALAKAEERFKREGRERRKTKGKSCKKVQYAKENRGVRSQNSGDKEDREGL